MKTVRFSEPFEGFLRAFTDQPPPAAEAIAAQLSKRLAAHADIACSRITPYPKFEGWHELWFDLRNIDPVALPALLAEGWREEGGSWLWLDSAGRFSVEGITWANFEILPPGTEIVDPDG